ncbi:hypothetical protein WMQ47_22600, partial [Vibrio diabolicus]
MTAPHTKMRELATSNTKPVTSQKIARDKVIDCGITCCSTSGGSWLFRGIRSLDEQQQKFITRVPMTIKSAKEALMNLEPEQLSHIGNGYS